MNYAYLHGFASSSKSKKGLDLAERFAERDVELKVPDLNVPSFEELTYTGMLEGIDRMVAETDNDEPWRFVGSSMGGYVGARWAHMNPGRVDRLVLLCPGFDMGNRWAEILGDKGIADWKEEGSFLFFDPTDNLAAVHWELYEDAVENHPPYPEVDVPVLICHGREDEIVPLASSRSYVERLEDAELVVLQDNHRLHESVDEIARRTFAFFGLE